MNGGVPYPPLIYVNYKFNVRYQEVHYAYKNIFRADKSNVMEREVNFFLLVSQEIRHIQGCVSQVSGPTF